MIGTPSSNEMLRARRRTVGVFRRKRPYDVFSKAGSSFTSAAGVLADCGLSGHTYVGVEEAKRTIFFPRKS